MIVGLIVEGKFDRAALPHFFVRESGNGGRENFQPIFPDLDATGGDELVAGGWTQLIERIINEAKHGLGSRFESGLFQDEEPLDTLLIHLDLDIAELFLRQYRGKTVQFKTEKEAVDIFKLEFIDFLLEHDKDAPIDNIIFATPAPCTDGWILHGLGGSCEWNHPSRATKSALRTVANGCYSDTEQYSSYAHAAAAEGHLIKEKSYSYQAFSRQITN